jgi:uncharacterized membrane protein
MSNSEQSKQRYDFIDQFRGFVGVLMLLGHCSYYLNSIWKQLDAYDPLFPTWGQFALRYMGYLCAPGFLIMSGSMVWLSYHKQIKKVASAWSARWHLIQRGIFLVIIQMTWVNSSWGGFKMLNIWHLGIISTIGFTMILLSFLVSSRWQIRLAIALLILAVHPLTVNIHFDLSNVFLKNLMEFLFISGSFNKYPLMPWFALGLLGTVMATGWFQHWKTPKKLLLAGFGIGIAAISLAVLIRLGRGYGNIFSFSGFGTYSFFIDQKYPPSLFHNLWFFGWVAIGVSLFIAIGKISPRLLSAFSVPGKVPLFFYAVHLAILGIFVKRLNFFYLEGNIIHTFVGFFIMLAIMLLLSKWFYGVKSRSNNYFIRMI